MLPHWNNQQDSSEPAASHISRLSLTWSRDEQTQGSIPSQQARPQSRWLEHQQVQESYVPQAHLVQWPAGPGNQQLGESRLPPHHFVQWPGNEHLQESHMTQARLLQSPGIQQLHSQQAHGQSCDFDGSGLVPVRDNYNSRPGPSSWPQQLPDHVPDVALPHTPYSFLPSIPHIENPQPRLHPHIFLDRVFGGDYDPPPQKFNEVWPQLPPHDTPPHPAFPYPTNAVVTLDPNMFKNLPPSVVPSHGHGKDTVTSSHRDPIEKAQQHSKLGQRQKLVGIDRGEHLRLSCDEVVLNDPLEMKTDLKVKKWIPWNVQTVVTEGQNLMKRQVVNTSFLPTRETIISLANSSWNTVAQDQKRDDLRIWMTIDCPKDTTTTKLASVVDELQNSMKQDIQIFAFYEFGLGFSSTGSAKKGLDTERAKKIQCLIVDDAFLYATQTVSYGFHCRGGVATLVAFSHPSIIASASFLMYESELQLHKSVDKDSNMLPLFTIIATLYHWTLLQRQAGTFHDFSPDLNRSHHDRFVSLFQALTPAELAVLKFLLSQKVVTCARI
ncbi:hypothetical protein EDD22DRAFT_848475 [Suillus occidentalis]|nr:hypothetical protein EDD22DRAFT_848475 [Suillus occidentalis]